MNTIYQNKSNTNSSTFNNIFSDVELHTHEMETFKWMLVEYGNKRLFVR